MRHKADPESILLRLKPKDTMFGVRRETLDALCAHTGLNKTQVLHLALRALADRNGL